LGIDALPKKQNPDTSGLERTFCSVVSGFGWIVGYLTQILVFFGNWIWSFNWILVSVSDVKVMRYLLF
jgi:hypothetical protein